MHLAPHSNAKPNISRSSDEVYALYANKQLTPRDLQNLNKQKAVGNVVNYMLMQTLQGTSLNPLMPINPIFAINLYFIFSNAKKSLLNNLTKIDYLLNPDLKMPANVLRLCFEQLLILNQGRLKYDEKLIVDPECKEDLQAQKNAPVIKKIIDHPNMTAELLFNILSHPDFDYWNISNQTILNIYQRFCQQLSHAVTYTENFGLKIENKPIELKLFEKALRLKSMVTAANRETDAFLYLPEIQAAISEKTMPADVFSALVQNYISYFSNQSRLAQNNAFFALVLNQTPIHMPYFQALCALKPMSAYVLELLTTAAKQNPLLQIMLPAAPAASSLELNPAIGWEWIEGLSTTTSANPAINPAINPTTHPSSTPHANFWASYGLTTLSSSDDLMAVLTTHATQLKNAPIFSNHLSLLKQIEQQQAQKTYNQQCAKYLKLVRRSIDHPTMQTAEQLIMIYNNLQKALSFGGFSNYINSHHDHKATYMQLICKMLQQPHAHSLQNTWVQFLKQDDRSMTFAKSGIYFNAIIQSQNLNIPLIADLVIHLEDSIYETTPLIDWLEKLVQNLDFNTANQVKPNLLWTILDVGALHPNLFATVEMQHKVDRVKNLALQTLKNGLDITYSDVLQTEVTSNQSKADSLLADYNGKIDSMGSKSLRQYQGYLAKASYFQKQLNQEREVSQTLGDDFWLLKV